MLKGELEQSSTSSNEHCDPEMGKPQNKVSRTTRVMCLSHLTMKRQGAHIVANHITTKYDEKNTECRL